MISQASAKEIGAALGKVKGHETCIWGGGDIYTGIDDSLLASQLKENRTADRHKIPTPCGVRRRLGKG